MNLDAQTINQALSKLPELISQQETVVNNLRYEYDLLALSVKEREAQIMTDNESDWTLEYRKMAAVAQTASERRQLIGRKAELDKAKTILNTLINKWKAVRVAAEILIKEAKNNNKELFRTGDNKINEEDTNEPEQK